MTRRALALALFTSTAFSCTAPAYADTTRDRMPQIYTMTPMGVNIQSGTFVHSETDFTIGSLSFVRAWRSIPSAEVGGAPASDHHRFGSWNHNYGFAARWHPTINDGVEIYADGKVYQFRWTSVSSSWSPWNLDQHNNNAFGTTLTGSVGSNLVFRNTNGDVYTFNSSNQATNVVYADGSRLDLLYASGRLDTVLSNRGDAIVLDYNANGVITTACGYNRALVYVDVSRTCTNATPQVKVSYSYASTGAGPSALQWKLASVTGADNVVTQMTYDSYYRPNLLCITLPGSSPSPTGCRVTNVYGAQPNEDPVLTLPDQVRRQTTATGEVWHYFYENMHLYADWPPIVFGEIRQTSGTMTDPLGRETRAEYENGFLRRLYAPEGLTQYAWGSLNPSLFTYPGGNRESLAHDYRNNMFLRERQAAPGSGEATITTRTVFPGHLEYTTVNCTEPDFRICNKPLFTIDERGNRTDYTHASAHGGVLTVTRPAPTTGAVRPQTRYTYSQIYAGVMNSTGTAIVSETNPVWVLTQESECRTQSSCAGTTDEVRTVYEYGPSGSANALRLRGRTVTDNAAIHRTCFTYDAVGNRISETGPGAQLASCPAQ